MSLADTEAALSRAVIEYHGATSYTEIEQAFLDRRTLANAVNHLREAIGTYQDRVGELQDDIDQLTRESSMLNQQMRDLEHHVLTEARWVEVEPGAYVNPAKVHWVRDVGDSGRRCQLLLGTTGLYVDRTAAEVIAHLTGDLR